MKAFDICVVGEINLDLILYGLPQELVLERELLADGLALTLGSSSAIFAHNLATLGTKVSFVSMIGNDALGKIALERLTAPGVDVSAVRQSQSSTQTGLTVILPSGKQRYILTYPGAMFEFQYSDIDLNHVRSCRHLHLSSYFLHRALRPQIRELFREARAAGLTTSLDTNDDPEDRWDADLFQVLEHVDILFVNEREAPRMAHEEDYARAIDRLAKSVRILVAKRGAEASICRSDGNEWRAAPPSVSVVDTVGAGDSFAAGFIHQFLKGSELQDCLAFANVAGAYSTTKEGGTEAFRDRAALQNFIQQHARRGATRA